MATSNCVVHRLILRACQNLIKPEILWRVSRRLSVLGVELDALWSGVGDLPCRCRVSGPDPVYSVQLLCYIYRSPISLPYGYENLVFLAVVRQGGLVDLTGDIARFHSLEVYQSLFRVYSTDVHIAHLRKRKRALCPSAWCSRRLRSRTRGARPVRLRRRAWH